MLIISAVGLFCSDKFEETPNEKVSGLSKLTKPYFRGIREYADRIIKEKWNTKLIFKRKL